MRLPFAQIDAFAEAAFAGNPAAVIPLPRWLDDAVLQSIASENNLSETAFIVASDDGDGTGNGNGNGNGNGGGGGDADFDLRWFTPAAEVALCGHATLASGHFVLSSDVDRTSVRFRTRRAGMLEVARDGDRYRMALPAWEPAPRPLPEMVAALGVEASETLWHDSGYALILVADEAAVRATDPDDRALAALGPYVAIVAARGDDTDIVSRVFTPYFDIAEDPVTGSAHAVMVPYWAKRLGRDRFTARQASRRGGLLSCALEGDRVILGGSCVTVIEGTFLLP